MIRETLFALGLFATLSIPFAAQQPAPAPAHSARNAARHSASTRPASPTSAAQAAASRDNQPPNTNTSCFASTTPKACDPIEQRSKLLSAQHEFDNLRLEKAAAGYDALLASCDPRTQVAAALGLKRAHVRMSTWWWLEGRYFPPLRWVRHPRFWEALWKTLVIILAIGLVAWVMLAGSPRRATIMTPLALTDKTQVKLFTSLLESSSQEVRHVLERAGRGLQVRATTLLALPSGTTSELVSSLPTVKGVDVAGIAKFFLYLKRYLGWRIDSEVGYCPPTKCPSGSDSPSRIVASASLRHAFWVRGGPWSVQRSVQHDYDVDGVAFAIAARIMGFSLRGKRARR